MKRQSEIQASVVIPAYLTYEGDLEDDRHQKQLLDQLDGVKNLDELHRLGWHIDRARFSELMRITDPAVGLTFEEPPITRG